MSRRYFIPLFVALILLIPVATASADLVPCSGPDCQACSLVQLGKNILDWVIKIMASIIALVFIYAGVLMVTSGGNTEGVSKAKSMMTNAVIGFVILMAAWLIVDTMLKLAQGGPLGVWNKIDCAAPVSVTPGTPTPTPTTPPSTTPGTPTPTSTPTSSTTPQCSDDAGLMAKYHGSPVGQEAPGLRDMIQCYLSDPAIAAAVDMNKIYTVDRTHPRCSLTDGNEICGSCSHSVNSCHYGRGSGLGAEAVDFNARSGFTEAQLYSKVQARQATCGGRLNMEGDHTHVSMPSC